MATVTKTIGTSSRDYSTISAWEADLNNAAIYNSGDDASGECYADSTFNESIQINGGNSSGLNSITLGTADNESHGGTTGAGVKISTTSPSAYIIDCASTMTITVQDIEIGDITMPSSGDSYVIKVSATSTPTSIIQRMIIHDITFPSGAGSGYVLRGYSDLDFHNNFVFAVKNLQTSLYGIYPSSSGSSDCYNNSYLNLYAAANNLFGLYNNGSLINVKNTICFLDTSGGATTEECFRPASASWDYNMSGDATAGGSNSLASETASLNFLSVTAGSENLHLRQSSGAIKTGVDLGTSPAGVNIDIDGFDRDVSGVAWDMGADQTYAESEASRRLRLATMSMEDMGAFSFVPF